MPHAIWKGQISFGLVNVPVALYPAEAPSELTFHLLDSRNLARLKYKRVNEVTGEEVPLDRVVKAHEQDDGEYVVLTDADFENADVEATHTIEIQDFVEQNAIPYPYFDKPYYVVPGKKAEKGYVLLREALRRTGKVAIAKVVIRTREYLAALIPQGNGLILDLLRYPHELRDINQYDLPAGDLAAYKISDRELEMAVNLINTMTTAWEPEKYHDEYRDALLAWIARKAKEGDQVQPPAPKPEKPQAEIVDFMELLKKSVEEKEKAAKPGRAPLAQSGGGRRGRAKKAAGDKSG